jgi:hypothetical protein
MRIASVLLVICCCLSAVSAQLSKPMTVVVGERSALAIAPVVSRQPPPGKPLRLTVGAVDTVGGTTYDWFTNGPILRMLSDSRRYGIHAVWMYSCCTSGTDFPDRDMRYNFYDTRVGSWNWLDPDYMQSGVNVFPLRAGYGSVDRDTNGAAVISTHRYMESDLVPTLAFDVDVGCGIFSYSDSANDSVCQWPAMATGSDGAVHVFATTTDYDLVYGRYADDCWSGWRTDFPNPGFPTQDLAASKTSDKVCATWVKEQFGGQDSGYARESPDGGATWSGAEPLEFPPAFSADTQPSFYLTGLFPFYDADDRLNIVADVLPCVGDTYRVSPAELWHYCPDNSPKWNRIHRAGCDPSHLQGSFGYNAVYAGRSSIGEDDYGNLFVTWEQFDSANVETTTACLRADIWASGSKDGGLTWSTSTRLTTPGTASCRYPSLCDRLWPGDSLAVRYLVDLCAGTVVMGQGPATNNPVVVQKVARSSVLQCGEYLTRLQTPNGGELLASGDTAAVKWAVTPRTFDHGVLLLSTDGGSTFPTTIKASIPPNDTMALWGPVPQLSCSFCRIKFEAKDSLGATLASDASYRNFTIDSVFTGVAENRVKPGTARPAPTIVRGVMFLPEASGHKPQAASLMDISGRKVVDLRPGANDVRALAPGVYFVREAQAQAQAQAVRKIVITR